MQQQWLIAGTVGAILILAGLILLRAHSNAWQKQQTDDQIDDQDLRHYRARYRRRMQAAALMIIIGVLIPVGDMVIPWGELRPKVAGYLWAIYWMGVLFLTAWVALLGFGDFASTSMHGKTSMAKIRARQRQLEQELARIKQLDQKDRNGKNHQAEGEDS